MSADAHSAMPLNLRLEEFILGEDADLWWIPKPTSLEQEAATKELARAVKRYERAFDTDTTCQQLTLLVETAQTLKRKNAAQDRIIAARADINAEAAKARADGDPELAKQIEAMPTPEYPNLTEDERELGYVK